QPRQTVSIPLASARFVRCIQSLHPLLVGQYPPAGTFLASTTAHHPRQIAALPHPRFSPPQVPTSAGAPQPPEPHGGNQTRWGCRIGQTHLHRTRPSHHDTPHSPTRTPLRACVGLCPSPCSSVLGC